MIVHVAVPRHTTDPGSAATSSPGLPLYLRGQVPTRVDVDGPAFLVLRQGKAAARYPFNRVARIVASQTVEWSARALASCLQHDIPVVFTDRQGLPAGYLHARLRSPSRLDAALTELMDRPDGLDHYTHWLRAERMHALQDWRRTQAAAGHPVEEDEFRERVRRHVYQADEEPHGIAVEALYKSAIQAYVLQQLHRSGTRTLYWGSGAGALNLAKDLADLLMLRLALELDGLGKAMHGEEAAMLTVLHNFGQKVQNHSHILLSRLHKHTREVLEQWL